MLIISFFVALNIIEQCFSMKIDGGMASVAYICNFFISLRLRLIFSIETY